MVLFADSGWFPDEWYWDAILFASIFGLPLIAVAVAVDIGVRRWLRPLRGLQRVALAVAVLAGGTGLILAGIDRINDTRFERDARAVARGIDFPIYAPKPLPRGLTEVRVDADDYGGPALLSTYATGVGTYIDVVQQPPGEVVSLQPNHCRVRARSMPGTYVGWDSPCRAVRSQRGVDVYITDPGTSGIHAFALLDRTLVRLQYQQATDQDVLAYFDSLQPVAKDDLEFKRG